MYNKLLFILHKPLLFLMKSKIPFDLKIIGEDSLHTSFPAIYAVNHTNSFDIPVASAVIKKHHYVLLGTQPLEFLDRIAFKLNGVVWVDRKDKHSKAKAKQKMIDIIKSGTNILMFPEGTWNRTENELMLPLHWGIIDIAKECSVPVVPIILDYSADVCTAKIGKPLFFNKADDKKESIDRLRDAMATLRYELWEQNPMLVRNSIKKDYFKNILQKELSEYPKLDLEYELSVVRKEYEKNEDVFINLNSISPNQRSAFLFNKRTI